MLFGDGAAGVFIERSEEETGLIAEILGSDGAKGMSLTGGYSPVVNVFNDGEKNYDIYIKMDGKAIFDFATRKVPKCVKELMEKAGIDNGDIDYVLPHQANSRIVEIISRKLKIPMDKFYINMYNYGNTSSASIPIALNEMAEKGYLKEGTKLVICGFGAGLTWGAAYLKF